MVRVRLEGTPPPGTDPYISDATIRRLIDGGSRNARGWRTDDDFYTEFLQHTFPERETRDNWTDGTWRKYWFARVSLPGEDGRETTRDLPHVDDELATELVNPERSHPIQHVTLHHG